MHHQPYPAHSMRVGYGCAATAGRHHDAVNPNDANGETVAENTGTAEPDMSVDATDCMVDLSEPETVGAVCTTYLRFVPCRRCERPNRATWSTARADIETVLRHQKGHRR